MWLFYYFNSERNYDVLKSKGLCILLNKKKFVQKLFNTLVNYINGDKLYVPKQIVLTVPKKELLVVLPFLRKFSLKLRKRLYKAVSKSLPQCNIKVIFQSKSRLSSLFKFKDSIPLYLRSMLFTNFSVVIAILLTMAKLNVILKLELVSI